MYCENCGKKINPEAKFCGGCGQQFTDSPPSQTPPAYVHVSPTPAHKAKLPGTRMLNVIGILAIIFGSLGLLSSLDHVSGVVNNFHTGIFGASTVTNLIHGIYYALWLITGILTISYKANAEKADMLKTLGVTLLIAMAAASIASGFASRSWWFAWQTRTGFSLEAAIVQFTTFAIIFGALHVLLFVGASNNKTI